MNLSSYYSKSYDSIVFNDFEVDFVWEEEDAAFVYSDFESMT